MPHTLRHLALIMDGNGRWAESRGESRTVGHMAGIESLKRCVEFTAKNGIKYLTVYAFSVDNWKRPRAEVKTLMSLMRQFLATEVSTCLKHGIRINVIGRRDRLPNTIRLAIANAERLTRHCERLVFRLAIDYGSRDVLERATSNGMNVPIRQALEMAAHSIAGIPDVDLLIRTGGEHRLSDFLLWEVAYAELWFTQTMWPAFTVNELQQTIFWYQHRQRRFGGLPLVSGPVHVLENEFGNSSTGSNGLLAGMAIEATENDDTVGASIQ